MEFLILIDYISRRNSVFNSFHRSGKQYHNFPNQVDCVLLLMKQLHHLIMYFGCSFLWFL